jgi:predicted nucleic acid-binding protein
MRLFLDSSAFAKRFVEEAGSGEVESLCLRAGDLGLSVICVPEVVSALNRRLREQGLTSGQYAAAKQRLAADVRDAELIQLTPAVIARSIRLLERNTLRAMDALHLACAVEWGTDLFATADRQQFDAASREALQAVNV